MVYPVTQSVLEIRRRKACGVRLCWKCKVEKQISQFYGKRYLCKECCKLRTAKPSDQWNATYYKKYARTANGRYVHAKIGARKRELSWGLSKEEYVALTSKPCFYCDGPLPEAGIGLDRKDNSIGYEVGNVVPCCSPCNSAKGVFFTFDEMVNHIAPAIRTIRLLRSKPV